MNCIYFSICLFLNKRLFAEDQQSRALASIVGLKYSIDEINKKWIRFAEVVTFFIGHNYIPQIDSQQMFHLNFEVPQIF